MEEALKPYPACRATLLLSTGLAASTLGLVGCTPPPSPPLASLQQVLQSIDPSWTMLPLPNSALMPGSIIQIDSVDGSPVTTASTLNIRLRGNLSDCGFPADVLSPLKGTIASIGSGRNVSLDASIAAKAAGIDLASVSGTLANDVTLTIGASTDQILDIEKLRSWQENPANDATIARSCVDDLNRKDVYVVPEAFVITSGSYSFTTSSGGSLSVAPPHVPVGVSTGVTLSTNGSVSINSDTVFAIKEAQQIGNVIDLTQLPAPPTHPHGMHHGAKPAVKQNVPPGPPITFSGKQINLVPEN